ncbi:Hypothetical predicted protein [Marmota monax]|uniref:Uncharacterized protein n=1 Tax=Marmota monax TaxID=9995 RepID=A0A5E4AYS7_MARMO|nr:hypothetical protein GHT09_000725 [Marmota monax]VTJ62010.1 Hypothetical predicted protein [Marmota monax]
MLGAFQAGEEEARHQRGIMSRALTASLNKLNSSPAETNPYRAPCVGIELEASLSAFPSSWHTLNTGLDSIRNHSESSLGPSQGISTNS